VSQRYRRERARNGMIADPAPLNINNNEYASEFNGYFDRENIPADAISETHIVGGSFTRVLGDPKIDTVSLDATSQTSQRQDSGGNEINSATATVATDSIIHVEWSGGLEWAGSRTGDCVRVQIVVNGTCVASTGFLSSLRAWQGVALSGTLPVQAGPLEVHVEGMIANISQLIVSPWIFTIHGAVNNTVSFTNRNLVTEIRSR